MKLIKINKTILLVAFFMPFFVTECQHPSWSGANYSTKKYESGFGYTHEFLNTLFKDGEIDIFGLFLLPIPLAFITSILGLIFTFYQKLRFIFYLSLLNLTCFIVLIILVIWQSLEGLYEFLQWGFWLSFILSIIDVILIKRNSGTISIT